jgi:hypothetical protein
MCMACEEDALWLRYQLEMAVARDEIPPGFEPEDFEWAGLPVPSKRAPISDDTALESSSAHARAGGNPEMDALGPRLRGDERTKSNAPFNPFACDALDNQ